MKGVLGMAFNSDSTGNEGSGDPTVFQNLIAQKQLENNVFSFYLNRWILCATNKLTNLIF